MRWKLILALIVLSSTAYGLVSAPQQTSNTTDNLRTAHRFIRSLYSELASKGLWMSLSAGSKFDGETTTLSEFSLYVGEGPKDTVIGYLGGYVGDKPPAGYQEGPMYPKQLLETNFQFNSSGQITGFTAQGIATGNREAEQRFNALTNADPKMDEKALIAALKKAGAKYSPLDKEQFVKNLPLTRLEQFLGKLKVTSVTFPPYEGPLNTWPIGWTVRATAKPLYGSEREYELEFEPFNGDLIGIKQPGRHTGHPQ